jgi:Patatin-like phospholipase
VSAAETRRFEPFIFKTPHHPDYRLDWKQPMALAAKTTSAAPSFFTPVHGDGYEFVDGGIWANNPIMIGVADALACFDLRRERIRVLSLGCVQDEFHMTWARVELPKMADDLFDELGDRIAQEFLSAPAAPYTPFYTPSSPPAPPGPSAPGASQRQPLGRLPQPRP